MKRDIVTLVIVALVVHLSVYFVMHYVFKTKKQREAEANLALLEKHLIEKDIIS